VAVAVCGAVRLSSAVLRLQIIPSWTIQRHIFMATYPGKRTDSEMILSEINKYTLCGGALFKYNRLNLTVLLWGQ
jgi:hypothetical protein